jgi:hypothetical protein
MAVIEEHDSVQSSSFLFEKTTAQPTPSSMKIVAEVESAEITIDKKCLEKCAMHHKNVIEHHDLSEFTTVMFDGGPNQVG